MHRSSVVVMASARRTVSVSLGTAGNEHTRSLLHDVWWWCGGCRLWCCRVGGRARGGNGVRRRSATAGHAVPVVCCRMGACVLVGMMVVTHTATAAVVLVAVAVVLVLGAAVLVLVVLAPVLVVLVLAPTSQEGERSSSARVPEALALGAAGLAQVVRLWPCRGSRTACSPCCPGAVGARLRCRSLQSVGTAGR